MPSPWFIVGYALTAKKTKSFMQPKLESYARSKGITFVAVDRNKALVEQGPFDVILHKLTGKEWRQELEDYVQKFPGVTVLDSPNAIQQLRNRQSMLQDVADLNLPDCDGQVRIPKQLVVVGDAACIPTSVAEAGLKLPLVAKPLVADGSAKSHAMSLAYDGYGLSALDTPLVLQEFVNHGGVLFKVYVVGDAIKVVRRYSLPDLEEGEKVGYGLKSFPRVSCAAATAEEADLDPEAGLTAGLQTTFPAGISDGKAHVTYHHDYATLHAKIHGFKAAPELELSANFGNRRVFAGGSLLYNSESRAIGMTKAGIGYVTEDFTGSMIIDPLIEKSFYLYFTRFLSPRCQVGTHIHRLTEKGLTSAKVAGSYLYNSQTTLKGRFDDKGLVAGVLQFSPNPLVTFSLLAEVNSRDFKAQPNIGLSLSVLAA